MELIVVYIVYNNVIVSIYSFPFLDPKPYVLVAAFFSSMPSLLHM